MIRVALIGITAVFTGLLLKKINPEISLLIGITAALFIFLISVEKLSQVVDMILRLQSYIRIDTAYISILLKMVGITYIAEFSSSLCKDAGYGTVAHQIELVGKLMILTVSMPVLLALIDTIEQFL